MKIQLTSIQVTRTNCKIQLNLNINPNPKKSAPFVVVLSTMFKISCFKLPPYSRV